MLLAGMVVLAIVVATVAVLMDRNATPNDPGPAPTAVPTVTFTPSPPVASDAAGAAGCLGGVNPNLGVLTAQDEAEITPQGAAAFAATAWRWRVQVPMASDYEDVAAKVFTDDASSDLLTRADIGDGTDAGWSSFAQGRYDVPHFDREGAIVQIATDHYAEHRGEQYAVIGFGELRLRAVDGRWRVIDISKGQIDPEELMESGFRFQNGC